MATGTNAWIEGELAGCHFADERLGRRLSTLFDQLAGAMGDSIPLACQDWANTKAAYRFFANERVSDADNLAGHFDSSWRRQRQIRLVHTPWRRATAATAPRPPWASPTKRIFSSGE
ncbi:hypothetical protein GAY30_25260 [Azospirillum brasilense]|uniref:IS4/Tn5 family transposase DNA-binding protein n=1 Tax=Azospirillum brasilense TaxID=192 RepID=UPI000E694B52|nr:transposase [Azospirillum brasilense]NUB28151.1 hypothetical protein [Azospirillum brasilense]NUB35492.1 hypothetical protein [Azospirillum brasilense]RIW02332.1 transposase [Azospirillum brasilense]